MLNKEHINGILNLTYKYNKSFPFNNGSPDQNIMQVYFIENNINVTLISKIYKTVKVVFYENNKQIKNEKIIHYVNKKPLKSNKLNINIFMINIFMIYSIIIIMY